VAGDCGEGLGGGGKNGKNTTIDVAFVPVPNWFLSLF